MSNEIFYGGHKIEIGGDVTNERYIVDLLRQSDNVQSHNIKLVSPEISYEQEERGLSVEDPSFASAIFENNRRDIRDSLRAIISFIIKKFDVPTDNGLDLGSGATGEMVEQLLPLNACSRRGWTQLDVNPSSF